MMKLHGYWRSSASSRVRIALALKGIEAQHIAVNLRVGEQREAPHLARNPQGFLPVLELGRYCADTKPLCAQIYSRRT